MKKINLILIGGAISTLMLTQSCQQPEADQATIDAKVTEMYNAEKMKVENEAATACEDAISAQVKVLQDSLSHLSAKAQADLLAKTQRELKAAQMKAEAAKKKTITKATVKSNAEIEKERKANSMGSGDNAPIKVTKEQTQQKANSMGSGDVAPIKVTEEQTKSKASKMGTGN